MKKARPSVRRAMITPSPRSPAPMRTSWQTAACPAVFSRCAAGALCPSPSGPRGSVQSRQVRVVLVSGHSKLGDSDSLLSHRSPTNRAGDRSNSVGDGDAARPNVSSRRLECRQWDRIRHPFDSAHRRNGNSTSRISKGRGAGSHAGSELATTGLHQMLGRVQPCVVRPRLLGAQRSNPRSLRREAPYRALFKNAYFQRRNAQPGSDRHQRC